MSTAERLGPYTLTVPEGVFPLGGDALALGEFATIKPGWRVCDLGTGSGVLLLLLAGREKDLSLTGVELEERSAQAARENLRANGLTGEILWGDLRENRLDAGQFDLVIANPPYFPVGSGTSGGPFREERCCTLEQLCAAAGRLTRNGGRFALCHRPERLTDVLCALRSSALEPKRLQLAAHSRSHRPSLVLVEAVKQGRPGLEVLPVRMNGEARRDR